MNYVENCRALQTRFYKKSFCIGKMFANLLPIFYYIIIIIIIIIFIIPTIFHIYYTL